MELLSSERLKSLLDLINKVTAIFGREKTTGRVDRVVDRRPYEGLFISKSVHS